MASSPTTSSHTIRTITAGSPRMMHWRNAQAFAREIVSPISAPGSGDLLAIGHSGSGEMSTGIDLSPNRVQGAAELTALVGLEQRVRVIEGDVTRTGLPSEGFDVVVSQEAFLHVPDKAGALAGYSDRVEGWPSPTGSFTGPSRRTRPRQCGEGWPPRRCKALRATATCSTAGGFIVRSVEDLTEEWGMILEQRFAMYRKLRQETLRQGLPAGDEEFYAAYGKLVELVKGECWAVGASLPRNHRLE